MHKIWGLGGPPAAIGLENAMTTWRETFTTFLDLSPSDTKAERAGKYIGTGIGLVKVAVAVAPVALAIVIFSAIGGAISTLFWVASKLWEYATRPRQLRTAQDALEAHGFKPEKYLPRPPRFELSAKQERQFGQDYRNQT